MAAGFAPVGSCVVVGLRVTLTLDGCKLVEAFDEVPAIVDCVSAELATPVTEETACAELATVPVCGEIALVRGSLGAP